MKRCDFFDRAVNVCGHVEHVPQIIGKEDLIPLFFIVAGICWLMKQAFETPPDVPPPKERWPFGD